MMTQMYLESVLRITGQRVPFFLKPVIHPVLKAAVNGSAKPRLEALFKTAESDLAETGWFAS